jgi:hypothetical protein
MTTGTALVPVEGVDVAVDLVAQQVAEAKARAEALQVSNDAEANVAGEILRADEKAINAAMREGIRKNGQPPEIPGVVFEQVSELAVRA